MSPTRDVSERRIAALEGGAAAMTCAVQNIARAGDLIVSDNQIYDGTYNLFANTFRDFGIETSFVDGHDPKNFLNAIKPNTVRFSIGTEHIDDILNDLTRGFEVIK
ncbi:MAG: PLP-dependent transferase [Treponema sp.]|jgi:O-acetylhomoserine (thiol)-lyase|nr:PLP-dependent transferase [Treponema sp.]